MFLQTLSFPARRRRALALAALAALGLAGCGRYGPLEPPGGAAAAAPAATTPDQTLNPQTAKPKIPPIVPPHQAFILDPLLK